MPEAVIAAAVRTPIGRAGKGSLVDVRPDDLLAFAIKEAVGQVEGLDPGEIVDVMVGCGFPQEKQGMNLARRAALLAGLPKSVPGTTVNRFCASSLQTARMAFHAIKAGEGDVYVAAGVESISQVDGYPKDSEELHPKLVGEGAIANVYIPMGLTAENVAERYDVSREDMDRFAQRSQERAVAAQASGFFARELTPYTKEDGTVVSADDGPRPSSTFEKLQELAARLQAGRKRDRRQLLPAERRRRRARDHVRGAGERARRQAAGAHHRQRRHRPRPGDHGRRPDRRRAARCSTARG